MHVEHTSDLKPQLWRGISFIWRVPRGTGGRAGAGRGLGSAAHRRTNKNKPGRHSVGLTSNMGGGMCELRNTVNYP